MSGPYQYQVALPPTSISTAKTLIQIKPVTAPIYVVRVTLNQLTKTSTEFWRFQLKRWTGGFTAGTVTSFTPTQTGGSQDPASLAVGGTSATGYNATVEPSGGTATILDRRGWNLLNGEFLDIPIPEGRREIRSGELFTVELITVPAQATSLEGTVDILEYN